ncbi:2-oxoacid:acceptor oxidoreductase family protein [Natranaerofaba carboxydovora]|uniref:2-oxoacid:acceptor oxidoreductase family protein n=1 Tax=Natranaerofaba carboxydovora TaxID=2742683 RepID=UPI001F133B1A|nr:2-oxoacid:acceptor oxidoreductase family protein [Natranaerofaba carboxydovora]UMZ75229.1 NADH-dependent phenylglyoxylate dehydrogenase subunit gamma [Natranaerofaba carboxydovora]
MTEVATKITRIALAGEGGQGVQSVADILAEAANFEGQEALYIPNFGVEQRGGVSVAYVQISDKKIGSPKFTKGDIVIALSERAVRRTVQYVDKNTTLVYDSSLIEVPMVDNEALGRQAFETPAPENMAESTGRKVKEDPKIELPEAKKIIPIPANEIAKKELHPRVFNILILGVVIEVSKVLSSETVIKAIEYKLKDKFENNPKLKDMNFSAFEKGRNLIKEKGI